MSFSRILIRLLLLLVLIGVCWFGYQMWAKGRPDYYWDRAQSAIEANDRASARVYLQNLVTKFPDHSEGRLALAELLIADAQGAGRPASYAANPVALSHLSEAARLRSDDLELQKKLFDAHWESRDFQSASVVGERIEKLDPEHAGALYAQARRAVVGKDRARADVLINKLIGRPSAYLFQTFFLGAGHYSGSTDPAPLQQLLASAAQRGANTSSEELAVLSDDELRALYRVLPLSVAQAPDLETAHKRASFALTCLKNLATAQGDEVGRSAETASRLIIVLQQNHPLAADAVEAAAARSQFDQQAEQLRSAAIAAGNAPPLIYHHSALSAFARGEHEAAAKTLAEGIAANAGAGESQRKEVLDLHLLAARNLLVMRKFSQAKPHIEALLADDDSSGWGHLLQGNVVSVEGRLSKALEHYLIAERQMGRTVLVRMALANTYLRLRRWPDALPHLSSLHGALAGADVEKRAWAGLLQTYEEQLHWGELRCRLALDQWNEAQIHLAALRNTRIEPRAVTSAASYQWTSGQREQALEMVAQARGKYPKDLGLVALQAGLWQLSGRAAEAEQLVEELATTARDDLPSQLYLARWRLAQKKTDKSLELLNQLETRFPDAVAPSVAKAQALLVNGRAEEALEVAKRLQANPATEPLGRLLAATAEVQLQDLKGAADVLQQDDPQRSGHGALQLLQGQIAAAQGDYGEAIDAIGTSIDVTALRRRAASSLLRALLLLADQEGPEKAYTKLEELRRQHPNDPFLLTLNADLLFKQGRFDAGMESLNQLDLLHPNQPGAAYLKAAVWAQRGDVGRSASEVERALRLDPNHLPSLILAAELRLVNGQNDLALVHAREALAQNSQLWTMHLIAAQALHQSGRTNEALTVLQGVLQAQPDFLSAYRLLAQIQWAGGSVDQALAVYEQFRMQRDAQPLQFALVADEIFILCQAQREDRASELAELAAGDQPQAAQCLLFSQAFSLANQLDQARAWAERALQLADESVQPAAHLALGELALQQHQADADDGRLADARDHFAAVLEAHPTNLVAGNNLAWLLATEFNDPQRAVAIVEQIRGEVSVANLPVSFVDTLAEVYRRADKVEEARGMLEQAVAIRPDDARLLYQLGMVLADGGRASGARNALERALQIGLPADRQAEAQRRIAGLGNEVLEPEVVEEVELPMEEVE